MEQMEERQIYVTSITKSVYYSNKIHCSEKTVIISK